MVVTRVLRDSWRWYDGSGARAPAAAALAYDAAGGGDGERGRTWPIVAAMRPGCRRQYRLPHVVSRSPWCLGGGEGGGGDGDEGGEGEGGGGEGGGGEGGEGGGGGGEGGDSVGGRGKGGSCETSAMIVMTSQRRPRGLLPKTLERNFSSVLPKAWS